MGLAWDASLTDAGVSMISQWAQGAGDRLTITKAVIGEGIVAASQLHLLTQLTDEKSTISIQGFESVANGVKLKLKKTSQGITTSFTLNQIGVYAKLDTSGGTPIIAESLIGVYQQDTGVLIPTEAEAPDFAFTFYGTLQTNYSGDLTINVDTSALLSQDDIADDLVTADATMALSANMGVVIRENIEAIADVYGAKNENSYPYEDSTKTDNGITFVDNGDGSVTVSGTAGANVAFKCHDVTRLTLPTGKHKINGCPAGGSGAWFINITEYINGVYSTLYSVDENGLEITADNTKSYGVMVWVASGTVISTPVTFYPMLRDARITDPTFAPYAKTNQQLTKDVSGLSNRNLVDNGWFTVNQRGAASYSTSGVYTADRWYLPFGGLTVGISSSGATLTATSDTVFWQKYETDELKGKTVTLSIKHFDGTIEHGTVQFPTTLGNNVVTITGGELQANVDTYGNCYFRIYIATGNTITARAVKLEVGTVSTLHLDVAPDYTTELLKCQWHFERARLLGIGNSQSVIGIGYAVSATVARITIFAKAKRDIPTISTSGTLTLHDGSSVTALSYEEMTDSGIVVNATSSGLTSGNVYLLRLGDTSSYIDFASDL